jgi:rSAM/selenodomain-associated transferase 2
MSVRVSVVIPTRNEESWIETSVRSAFDAGAADVVVSDGGSTDTTTARARALGAAVIDCEGIRSHQLNSGFDSTSGEVVCFLHADTRLPAGACSAISEAVTKERTFGGFLLRFAESDARLTLAALMINMRTRITRAPWGDQAQFVLRDAFEDAGRFAGISIMEDYDMALRMKQRTRPVILRQKVVTSGRRFLELGVLRTALTNWRIVIAWHRGVPADRLRKMYGSR